MKEVFPNYYHKFECIADKCEHSCCIGWEIDIDEETLGLYYALGDELGERIRANIEGDVPHFRLGDHDRCPFLMKNGLCEIICAYGEDALCDICYLHPRFRNFFDEFIETGIGLSCCEAVRIVLSEDEKFTIEQPDGAILSKSEKVFFEKREEIFKILQNRNDTIKDRLITLSNKFDLEFGAGIEQLYDLYKDLERLDAAWGCELDNLKEVQNYADIFEENELQLQFEQIAVYFVFRHLQKGIVDGEYSKMVRFVILSCCLLGAMCSYYKKKCSEVCFEKLVDLVRMYSGEIEYCEENTNAIAEAEL